MSAVSEVASSVAINAEAMIVSVVIPCLNEATSIGTCVAKARQSFDRMGVVGEVIVVDNGSTDRSAAAAVAAGATVIYEPRRGYGSAYLAGLNAASGKYLVMGDGDDTYDFSDVPAFVSALQRNDADIVMGDRLNGDILPGAMSWSHRWIGNPILSGMLRLLFRTRVSDAHCGMRALTKTAYVRMRLGATGMEFASEMVISALRARMRIVEIPITYHPRQGVSKLQGIRDAWRHTRFMLMFSPSYLFLLPGSLLMIAGALVSLALINGPRTILGHRWDYHPLLFGAGAMILGYNLAVFDVLAKSYAMAAGFAAEDQWLGMLGRCFSLERGVAVGAALLCLGLGIEARIVYGWILSGYGELMAARGVVMGMTAMVIGLQTIFGSFLVSFMQIRRA